MRPPASILSLLALLGPVAACGEDAAAPQTLIAGTPVEEYVHGRCGMCHGATLEGAVGPSLLPGALTRDDTFYLATIRDGRPGTVMPSFAQEGLNESEIATILCYLRGLCASGEDQALVGLPTVDVPPRVEMGELEVPGAARVRLPIENHGEAPVELVQIHSQSSMTPLVALPVTIPAGGRVEVPVEVHVASGPAPGSVVRGSGVARLRTSDGEEGQHRFVIEATARAPASLVAFDRVPLTDVPVRVDTQGDLVYVAYLGGVIDVFRWIPGPATTGELALGADHLTRVERITTIAETQNWTPDGEADPFVGRLVGGMDVAPDGTIYLTHTDVRMDEYTMAPRGAEADLSSGTLTRLAGPPGSYGAPGHRLDLVTGLPRNVDNHFPLGVAVRDDWVWFTQCALTDGGKPDAVKTWPDTPISGTILRVSRTAPDATFPLVVAPPGRPDRPRDVLQPGVFEIWSTGVRNAFGLAWSPAGELFLTDNSRDGGGHMISPRGMVPQQPGWSWRDHLHVAPQGAFLGQPNASRGEKTMEDGSKYLEPQPRPDTYVPEIWAFGAHTGAGGLAFVHGEAFPELDGWLLAAQFLPDSGHLLALQLDGHDVVAARTLMYADEATRAADVAIGPHGEIVVAMISPPQLRVARGAVAGR